MLLLSLCSYLRYYKFNGKECSLPHQADMTHNQRSYHYRLGNELRYHLCMTSICFTFSYLLPPNIHFLSSIHFFFRGGNMLRPPNR